MKNWIKIPALMGLVVGLHACATVKPYEKAFINDEEMKLAPRKEQVFEINSETYREGSSGGIGTKTGGGCGCY